MNRNDRIAAALDTAANTTGSESRWYKAHAKYLIAADANRPVYRALLDDAAEWGVDAAAFNAAVRGVVDTSKAGDDSGEWIRAGRIIRDEVLDACEEPTPCEPAGWFGGRTHEQARFEERYHTEQARLHI